MSTDSVKYNWLLLFFLPIYSPVWLCFGDVGSKNLVLLYLEQNPIACNSVALVNLIKFILSHQSKKSLNQNILIVPKTYITKLKTTNAKHRTLVAKFFTNLPWTFFEKKKKRITLLLLSNLKFIPTSQSAILHFRYL